MRRNNRKRKYPKYFFILCFGIFLFVGVGYSIINSTLGITGTVVNSKNNWNIKLVNINYDSDSVASTGATITGDTQLNIKAALEKPGDVYGFSVDLVNNGSLPALIQNIEKSYLNDEQEKYLEYSVTYEDGTELEKLDAIKSNETKKIKVRIKYKKLRDESLYPNEDFDLSSRLNLKFQLPEEEFYTLTLVNNNATKQYKVSNLAQDLTLSDVNILDTNKAIACDNGVVPTTNTTNQIVLKRIKKNATCRIVNSLKDGIEKGSTNEHVTLLNNDNITSVSQIVISQDKTIVLDLNGKTHIAASGSASYIVNKGKFTIKDTKENGTLQTDHALIDNETNSILIINNGNYIRKHDTATNSEDGFVIGRAGTITIKNAYVESDATYAVVLSMGDSDSVINIYDSTMKTGPYQNGSIVNRSTGTNINVYNSNISSPEGVIDATGNVYLCNTTITSEKKLDFYGGTGNLYYSHDVIFSNKTNTPNLSSFTGNAVKTDLACGE